MQPHGQLDPVGATFLSNKSSEILHLLTKSFCLSSVIFALLRCPIKFLNKFESLFLTAPGRALASGFSILNSASSFFCPAADAAFWSTGSEIAEDSFF